MTDASLLYLGDLFDVLPELADDSIDAICCDPPYGLEFMGREWDTFRMDERSARWASRSGAAGGFGEMEGGAQLPNYGKRRTTSRCRTCGKRDAFRNPHGCGDRADWMIENVDVVPVEMRAFQNWCHSWALEAYRVLKPGGHLLAFGGTRTYHRLTVAIEDAGFDIRDSLIWIYGCLTPDVEVLTETGWRRGIDVGEGDRIAQWDPVTEVVTLAPVQETFRATWAGPMRVFRNADTDQIVTPNHRVYHRTAARKQRGGVRRRVWPEGWQVAEAADVTRHQPTKLPTSGFADGRGIGGTDYAELLAFVWTEGGFDRDGSGVRIYQSPSANLATTWRIARLVDRLAPSASRYDRERVYESRTRGPVLSAEACWFFTGPLAARVRADLPGKQPTYELLWRMTLAEKAAFLDAAMAGDGSGDGFEQKGRAPLEWFQTLAHLIGWSARVRMRAGRSTGTCALRRSDSTEMQARHFKAAYDAHHVGEVWCVRVPTGAFLARRNGLVFVTGNSGFPKSHDISKQLDKMAGAEREVVGEKVTGNARTGGAWARGEAGGQRMVDVTAPATDDARAWDGWGTALKPAHEPVVLARKPLVGTVAENVLQHGVGGLNVAACEIGKGTQRAIPGAKGGPSAGVYSDGLNSTPSEYRTDIGRWPANLVLSHLDECKGTGPNHTDVLCAPGCPVAELNAASEEMGIHSAGSAKPPGGWPDSKDGMFGIGGGDYGGARKGDAGGAARFFYVAKARRRERIAGTERNLHPTVKPVDLMRWLVRLVTPPGGTVLDPFMGSGSTGCAAMVEGFRFLGVERDPDSYETAVARIADWAFVNDRPRPERRLAAAADARYLDSGSAEREEADDGANEAGDDLDP